MKVYILLFGIAYEGLMVDSVFSSEESANKKMNEENEKLKLKKDYGPCWYEVQTWQVTEERS